MTQPNAIPSLAGAVTAAVADAVSFTRIGVVASYDASSLTIDIGGTLIPAVPYISSYRPLLGDNVVLAHSGASNYVVLGAIAGTPSNNVVLNPSFEDSGIGSLPVNWGWVHTGTASGTTVTANPNSGIQPIHGTQELYVHVSDPGTGFLTSTDDVYSEAFPVIPGERWSASAWFTFYAGVSAAFMPAQATLGVFFGWFNSGIAVPPAQIAVSASNLVNCFGTVPAWTQVPAAHPVDGNIVPVGASYGRVVLSSTVFIQATNGITGAVSWDHVIARKVG